MRDLAGPLHPWLGLVDAFGVGFALLGWLVLRGRGPRARLVGAAAGGVLLAGAVASTVGGTAAIGSTIALVGFRQEGGRRFFDILLALGGIGVGVAGALAVRARVVGYVADVPVAYDAPEDAYPAGVAPDAFPDAAVEAGSRDVVGAGDDRLDDRLDDGLADDGLYDRPDGGLADGDAGWTLAPWLDLLLVALATALPAIRVGLGRFGGFPNAGGDVTVLVVCLHLMTGLIAGGVLYVALHTGDTDERWPALAFVLVAVGTGLTWAFPRVFANEFWAVFAAGLALGLVAVSALPLVARLLTGDRRALAMGVVAGASLVVLSVVVSARVTVERISDDGGINLFNGDVTTPPDGPDQVFPSDFPSEFPTFPPFPTEFPPFSTGP
jgi:hypothetical protein